LWIQHFCWYNLIEYEDDNNYGEYSNDNDDDNNLCVENNNFDNYSDPDDDDDDFDDFETNENMMCDNGSNSSNNIYEKNCAG